MKPPDCAAAALYDCSTSRDHSSTAAGRSAPSAFYYLALAAGIVQKGDNAAYCTGSEVQAKLGALCGQPTAKAKDVANAARMSALLDALFGASMGHVRCLFARDWVLAGKPFRTTWTAGWWLTEREALTGGDAAADANGLALLGPEVQAAQEAAEAGRAATQAAQAERAAAEECCSEESSLTNHTTRSCRAHRSRQHKGSPMTNQRSVPPRPSPVRES